MPTTDNAAMEPCPDCGCPGEQYDGHVCDEYRVDALVGELPHTHGLVNPVDAECSPEKRCLRCVLTAALERERDGG